MATSPEGLRRLYEPLAKHVKTLLNNDLKTICRSEGLPVTGVKAALQQRVLNRLDEAVTSGDAVRFQEVASKIKPQAAQQYAPAATTYSSPRPTSSNAVLNGHRSVASNGYHTTSSHLTFTDSPFFRMAGPPLTSLEYLPVMSSNRNTVRKTISLSPEQTDMVRENKSYRIMLYCAVDDMVSSNGKSEIAFPSQIEVKVNGDLYQGNLRGIKKKSGTTRPADVTNLIRKIPHYCNEIAITYAATEKRYAFVVHMVREYSVDELVERIKRGNVISAQSVIDEMLSKAADPDVITTSTVMSLKCPLSFMRMELPCRSTVCAHNQCFDASSFLQVQQQAPQWACPICSKVFRFENLVIDRYVENILRTTSKTVEQITIEPNGSWKTTEDGDTEPRSNGSAKRKASHLDDNNNYNSRNSHNNDDDFLEVSFSSIKNETNTPQALLATPLETTRELSTNASGSKKVKRTHDTIIDLTLSSDEDDEWSQPVKQPVESLSALGLYNRTFGHGANGHATSSASARPAPRISFGLPSISNPHTNNASPRPADEPGFYSNWAG